MDTDLRPHRPLPADPGSTCSPRRRRRPRTGNPTVLVLLPVLALWAVLFQTAAVVAVARFALVAVLILGAMALGPAWQHHRTGRNAGG